MLRLIILFIAFMNSALGQKIDNPNNLPICPSSISHFNWNKCFGVYFFQGNNYSGEWSNGIMNGHGSFTYSTGAEYFGDIKNGKFDGNGEYRTKEGVIYSGQFQNGKFHDKGHHSDGKGNIYEGEWRNGVIEGYGTYIFSDGSKYVGEWKDGKSNGFGTHTVASGSKYVGEIKNGVYHGEGIIVTKDGNRVEGIFENGSLIQEKKSIVNSNKIENQIKDYFSIKPIFDWVGTFKEGLAAVRVGDVKKGKYGFVDKNGKLVINTKFDGVRDFHENLAAVRIGDEHTGKWGFVDKKGNLIIKNLFTDAFSFSEGLAQVQVGEGESAKWGFIDKKGNFVISAKFDAAYGFSDDLAGVRIGAWDTGKWGFIDKQGRFLIKPQYDEVHSFNDGVSFVRQGNWDSGKFGLINKQGKVVINFQYDGVFLGFREGLAAVRLGSWESGKWGFIDKSGNFLIKPQFDMTLGFHEGIAAVRIGDDKDGKWGFVDKKGEFLINPIFNGVGVFREGFASVKFRNNKTSYIDKKGNFLINDFFENEPQVSDAQGEFKKQLNKIPEFFSEEFAGGCIKEKFERKCGFISIEAMRLVNFRTSSEKKYSQKESGQNIPKLSLQVEVTKPDENGAVIISINTNTDTSSLKLNGEEQGGRSDGKYVIKRVSRVGQDTQFTISAIDIIGNTQNTIVTVARHASLPNENLLELLKPETIKRTPARDAVAIIIGIQNYKRLPKADFAANDAKEFSEYAIRALGVKPEKIKILIDDEADEVNMVKAFGNWLPLQVNKDKTDVYVFFSGHGLPSEDGKSLYFLPHGVDKELLSRTAVAQSEIIAALTAAKPKSVSMFIDACYSGQTKNGDVLLANARPISLKSELNNYPPNFTVITASANDQISSSSPELKHGIFSFYLMKAMEGDADVNKDGKVTFGEVQEYLSDKVGRQAMSLNRKQTPQLLGDPNKVLFSSK